jgi:raffinose synthase
VRALEGVLHTEEDRVRKTFGRWTLGIGMALLLASPVQAELAVKPSFYPNDLNVSLDGVALLERLSVAFTLRGADLALQCTWPDVAAVTPGPRLSVACRAGDVNATLRIEELAPTAVALSLDFERELPLAADGGLRLTAAVPGFERGLGFVRTEPWWMRPVFVRQQDFLADQAQLVLAQRQRDSVAVLPLAAGGALGFARGAHLPIAGGGLTISLESGAPWAVQHAPLVLVAVAPSPYMAVADAYRHGLAAMGNPGRLRTDKPYPEAFTRVGFCSWNSFYENQTEANLVGAARAFKAAGFPLGFMIIDAGWQQYAGKDIFFERLQSFEADAAKIPGGLPALVRALKQASGARWVGVWHALQGVPGGVDPESRLAQDQAGALWKNAQGTLLPDPTSAKGAGFYRAFYRYLKASGVDLVKVDFQNWVEAEVKGELPMFAALQQSVYNFHAAAKEAFGDGVINCMSMGHDLLFNLRDTNVVRNSLDYLLPSGPVGHRRHVLNNIFNALPVQQVAYPDFDMWEAYGEFAEYHSVLRALSAGPVYITGDVSRQDFGLVRRLILSDGSVLRTDVPVQPTRDSLFVNSGETPVPLKGFSHVGGTGIVGVFNVLESGAPVSGELRAGDVDGIEGQRFAVLEYFSHRLKQVGRDDVLPLQLAPNQAELYWVVPIEHGAAVFGLLDKYIAPRTVLARNDDGRILRIDVVEGGTLGVALDRAPQSVRVDGQPSVPTWSHGLLKITVDEHGPVRAHKIEIVR